MVALMYDDQMMYQCLCIVLYYIIVFSDFYKM